MCVCQGVGVLVRLVTLHYNDRFISDLSQVDVSYEPHAV